MSLPLSILTGLGEYWPYDEGAGAVAHGYLGVIDLDLSVSMDTVNDRWNQPATPNQFGGRGSAEWPTAWEVLEHVGDVITVAVEMWWGGYETQVTPLVFESGGLGYTGSYELWGMFGDVGGTNLAVSAPLGDGTPPDPSTNTYVYFGAGVGDGDGVFHLRKSPPYAEDAASYVWIMEIERTSGTYCTTRMWAFGARVQMDGVQYWTPTQGMFRVGDLGGVGTRGAAVWRRALTDDERDAIFTDNSLAGIPGAGGNDNPLVGEDGSLSIVVGAPVTRTMTGVTLATDGEHRHTRQVHERSRRRYALPMQHATPAEWDAVLAAVALSRGGAVPVLLRVPIDDDGAAPLVRYRILNAGAFSGLDVARSRGGVAASLSLELEEI